jgi:hypothetical protein
MEFNSGFKGLRRAFHAGVREVIVLTVLILSSDLIGV